MKKKNINIDKDKQDGDYSKNVVIGNPLPTSKIIPFIPHLTKSTTTDKEAANFSLSNSNPPMFVFNPTALQYPGDFWNSSVQFVSIRFQFFQYVKLLWSHWESIRQDQKEEFPTD